MKRIESPYAIDSRFTESDLTHPKTPMTATWLNSVQEELCHVIEGEGMTLNPAQDNQLLTALTRKRNRAVLDRSWEIPARFTGVIPPDRIDPHVASHHLSYATEIPLAQHPVTPVSGDLLPGFRFDKTQIISASFTALIERESEQDSFYLLMPFMIYYWGEISPWTAPWENPPPGATANNRFILGSPRTIYRQTSNLNLYASLLIDREGQMYIAGKNAEEGNYRGRISIYDLKTVKPIP